MHLYIDQSSQSSVDPTVAFILHILVYASFALLILVVVGAAFCAYFGIGFDIYDYRRIEDGEKDEEAAISISEQKPSDSNHSAYIPGVSYSHRSRYSVSTLLTLLPPPQTCPLPPALRAPVTKPNPIPIPKIVVTSPSGTSVLITGIPYNRRIVRPKPTIPSSTGFLTREKWVNKYVTTLPPPTKSTETGNRDSSLRRKPEGRIGRARSDSFYGGRPIIASGPLPPPSTAASTFTAASPTTATAAITSRPRSATVPAPASTPIVSGSGLPLLSMGPIMSVGIMKRNVNVSGLVSSGSKGKGKERKVQSEGKENVAVAEGC